jgi:cell surface protein SprA
VVEVDTTYVVYLDSTARLAHFQPVRRDEWQVSFFPTRTHPLFARVKQGTVRRDLTVDSLGRYVSLSERVGGQHVRVPLTMPLTDYVAGRRRYELRRLLAEEARKPPAATRRDDLGELLTSITQIQIPIPQNPILSIFGKPVINLNISGAVDIKAGFRSTQSDQTQLNVLDQTRNEPDFSQEVQVNVSGTIGDKLNILADWNTQRTFEYENQLKIKYTGYDDEIVQSVEAGNVSLATPSRFIGSSAALFGVKALFQAGPLKLTGLASQKKGQIKEVEVSGGSQQSQFSVQAWDYSTSNYFVDTSYISRYEEYLANSPPVVTNPGEQIIEEEVWVLRQGSIIDPNERYVQAFINLPPVGPGGTYPESLRTVQPVPGEVEVGRFVRLPAQQYSIGGNGHLGVVSLNTAVQDDRIIAISYRTLGGSQFGELARDYSADTSRPVILKLVKPANLFSRGQGYPTAWKLLLKNIYNVGGRNLKKEGFELDINRDQPGAEVLNTLAGERLLRILGLDRYDGDGRLVDAGDQVFDFLPDVTVNQARAEIVFPYLRPFDEAIRRFYAARGEPLADSSDLIFPEIYDSTKTRSQQNQIRNKYAIRGRATGEASSKYNLGFNVVEGSVKVLLDGRQLTPNVDFTVDYIIGEVVIRNERALVPGANLQITYEQNDLFQLASKTLLGARGDLALSQNLGLGFTIMNLNQQSLSDKVRLGEEPNNNTILGVDGATTIEMPFFTRLLDQLPLFQSRELSSLRISGEAAYMMPDPNTRKSPIPADGGEGIAYIDDFEGARRSIPLGINYSQWSLASPPVDSIAGGTPFGIVDSLKPHFKGKTIWFNRLPTDVLLTDVFPRKRPGNDANNRLTVLDLRYLPGERGTYNYSPDLDSTLRPDRNWGGIMKTLSVAPVNFVNENLNFLELWMQVNRLPASQPNLTMIVELGAISEDVIPNRGFLNDEDYVLGAPNSYLQEGEDVGLDMLTNAQEQARFGGLPGINQADPSGDDYAFSNSTVNTPQEDYSRINGTDNSRNSPVGPIPDTEDLNGNSIVDRANAFFRYIIPMNTDTLNFRNPYIVGGGNLGWYQFRVPLLEFAERIGQPTFENVEYVRILFVNAEDTVAVRIAEISLVGNQWQELRKDSTFAVSVISIEDNPAYESPPGVIRERDKTRPEEEVFANEQSLALLLNNVPDGEFRAAVKYYTLRPLDVFNYKIMKMFVHGDPSFGVRNENDYDAQFLFRFGADSLNYYQYSAPIHPGWDPRNDMTVQFSDLTAIKAARDSANQLSDPVAVPDGPPGAFYNVLGNPSLTQIRYLVVAVVNRPGAIRGDLLSGQVWVNELRLVSVDDASGWAYQVETQLKMADLGTISFNYSKVDPNFHTLEQRFGSRQTGTNWGANISMGLERFLPAEWTGSSMQFSYSHTEAIVRPRYLPNSDVVVEEAADRTRARLLGLGVSAEEADAAAARIITESETFRITDTYAAPTLRLGLPFADWYIRDTFNKLTFGFNYTTSTERSPAIVRSLSWLWSVRTSWAHSFSPDYYVQPFTDLFDGVWFLDELKNLKLFFPITNLSWSMSASRSRQVSLSRALGAKELTNRNFTASRQIGFGWKLTEGGFLNPAGDYSLQVESSLLSMETDRNGFQRPFSAILDDIFFGDRLINFGDNTRYGQRVSITTKPNVPNILGIKKFFDLTFGYAVDYSWTNQLQRGDLGKSVGWNSTINFSTNIRLKAIFDPLFAESAPGTAKAAPPRGRPGTADSTAGGTPDTGRVRGGGMNQTLGQLGSILTTLIKVPFLDYDNVNITFTQTNAAAHNGVLGRTGFANFWGIDGNNPENGPSRLYQLGLISDPSGELTNFRFTLLPPFLRWDAAPGRRAAGAVLANSFRQSNKVSLRTSRSLWEGARLDLTWNLGWSYARSENLQTDSLSQIPRVTSISLQGSVERSFLTFPDVLFLGMFKSNIKQVGKIYSELKASDDSEVAEAERVAVAFEEGFEALPLLRSVFGQYYPRPNWSFRWDGLERLSMFSGFVSRLSLDHAYTATYNRQFRNLPGSGEQTDGQRVAYGFAPLIGLNFTFKDLWKGSLGATVRYNSNTSYELQTSSTNIVETLSQEISVSASYSRRGFEIPLFGLALNNDLDITASYSITKNSRRQYEVARLDVNQEGTPLDGTTRTVMEPRIKYILSARVTASVYYRYTKVTPDDQGSRIPGSTINEAGLDIRISIQ